MSVSNFSNFALVEGLRAHNTGEKVASSGRTNSIKIGEFFLIMRKTILQFIIKKKEDNYLITPFLFKISKQ